MSTKPHRGRPAKYSEDIADEICERIACGETLVDICRSEGMPGVSTVLRWTLSDEQGGNPYFREAYARAKEMRIELMAEEIRHLSDTCREGDKTKTLADGSQEITTGDMIERSRLQVDSRKWLLARLAPKKYGDRVTQELTGADGGPIQTQELTVRLVKAEKAQ